MIFLVLPSNLNSSSQVSYILREHMSATLRGSAIAKYLDLRRIVEQRLSSEKLGCHKHGGKLPP